MVDFNGFCRGVIGKPLPADSTLNNMKKQQLIELLHIAEHNHSALASAYKCATDNSKCNRCPLTQKEKTQNNWIPVSERLPEAEVEVLITAKRKYRSGECKYIVTSAMYEDGTVLENDSIWNWIEIDGKYDEENDCYIVPEGWWECRHYNPDDVYNNLVDEEVIAWMPLPEPYREDV